MGNNEGKLRRNFISLPPEVSVWKEFHTRRCQCRSPPPLANVTISARHVSGEGRGSIPPRKLPTPLRQKFVAGRNFWKSHTLLLEYKKKPFEPDWCQISQVFVLLRLCPRPHLDKQLTELLMPHSSVCRNIASD